MLEVRVVRGHRRWISRDSRQRHLAERADEASFVTYVEAAAIAGTAVSTIGSAVRRGELVPREQSGTPRPSLRRVDVVAWAFERARRRRDLEEKAAPPPDSASPDDGHVWLDPVTAGLVLGLSANGVRYRVERGLLPHVRCGHRV